MIAMITCIDGVLRKKHEAPLFTALCIKGISSMKRSLPKCIHGSYSPIRVHTTNDYGKQNARSYKNTTFVTSVGSRSPLLDLFSRSSSPLLWGVKKQPGSRQPGETRGGLNEVQNVSQKLKSDVNTRCSVSSSFERCRVFFRCCAEQSLRNLFVSSILHQDFVRSTEITFHLSHNSLLKSA